MSTLKLATPKVTMHCPECGSEAITWEAQSEWNPRIQRFVISGRTECTCGDCAAEFMRAEERTDAAC